MHNECVLECIAKLYVLVYQPQKRLALEGYTGLAEAQLKALCSFEIE